MAMLATLAGCGDDAADEGAAGASTLANLKQAPPNTGALGCQSRSSLYPWGQVEPRTWTPRVAAVPDTPSASPGAVYGAPFTGRLIQAWGTDYGEARQTVIIERQDGCRRQYRTDSLSDADVTFLAAELAKHPQVPDPATYRVEYQEGLTSPELVKSGKLSLLETQHFAFWYGNGWDDSYDFAKVIGWQGRTKEEVLRETAEWYERQWFINRDAVGAPMPFADSADKRKLNVYLCGTGRPNADDGDKFDCGAQAGEAISISAWALLKGSNVVTHEFGHLIQYYLGGFPDPDANAIFETHAEWIMSAVNPAVNTAGYYFDNLENGPTWSVARYAAYPFLQYLFETDRTRKLVFDTWKPAVRQGPWSGVQRFFVETLVALGQRSGAYPDRYKTFADDMGWYGARLVAMDFLNQRALVDGLRPTRTTRSLGHFYTSLVAGPGGRYTPPAQRGLLQWGTHLIPLTGNAAMVKVTLTGATTAGSAAWRFGIVAVRDDESVAYSALGKAEGTGSGSTALAPPAGAKLYVAVTATPYRYENIGNQDLGKPVRGTRFPYSLKIEGATPRTDNVRACDRETAPGSWSLNYTLNGNSDQAKEC